MTGPDPTLPLLWRGVSATSEPARPKRGPKAKVSVDEVLDAAIDVADREGLAELSMRGLAQRLGLGAMSLYTYVPGRDELVVLMVDQVLGRTERPAHAREPRERLEQVAETSLTEYLEHPWLLEVAGYRAWLGPHAADRYEWQLAAIDDMGLDDVEMDQTVALLDGFAATTARSVHDVRAAQRRSGLTEREWWEKNAPALEAAMGERTYPIASRVGQATGALYEGATDPHRQFRFGLARIIDGVLAHIDTADAQRP